MAEGGEADLGIQAEKLDRECNNMPLGNEEDGGDYGEMDWKTVGYKRKKKKKGDCSGSSSSSSDLTDTVKVKKARSVKIDRNDNMEYKVIIEFCEPFHLLNVAKAIESAVGKVKYAKYLNNRRILVCSETKKQQRAIIETGNIEGIKVKTHIPGSAAGCRGVISGVPLTITIEEIKREMTGGKVKDAKRIMKKVNGEKTETMAVMIEFEKELPAKVMLGFFCFSVREFIPPALRCFKCQRMGHTATQCKGKERCARCGGNHSYGKCDKDAAIKCCNCGGDHSAAFAGCEVQKQAREVQRVKIMNRVSYAEAVKKVNSQTEKQKSNEEVGNLPTERSMPMPMPKPRIDHKGQVPEKIHRCKVKQDTLLVDRVNFVAFICKVVFVAMEQNGKSDRIETIVEAAREYLGISMAECKEIQEVMNPLSFDVSD